MKRSAGKIISELSKAAHVYLHAEFREYSIGHAQVKTLLFLSENEGVSQLELSRQFNLEKSSITSQLKILEKNGYITRSRSGEDGRMLKLYITEKTRGILKILKEIFHSWTEVLLDGFGAEEKAVLLVFWAG